MQFTDLNLDPAILRAVADKNYTTATPIQASTIPLILDGHDILGCAQTGTGKTAAFALPILHRLANSPRPKGANKRPRCLVLSPTRELANQISESFKTYGKHLKLYHTVLYGGVSQTPQIRDLRRGVDILIATPGRLMDLGDQGHIDLSAIQTLVLDEADRMLDMGFIPDIRKIVPQTPSDRQTLLFSATMPSAIQKLANDLLTNPRDIRIAPESTTANLVDQSVFFVQPQHKTPLLTHLLKSESASRSIVFTRTKRRADRLAKQLHQKGFKAKAIHGDKSQFQRQRALNAFKRGRCRILVATDVAARGIDVNNVSHVFNYDLSHEPDSYVHRIGRTARAGKSGKAITLCDCDEHKNLRAVERSIKMKITVRSDHPNEIPAGKPPASDTAGAGISKSRKSTKSDSTQDSDCPRKQRSTESRNARSSSTNSRSRGKTKNARRFSKSKSKHISQARRKRKSANSSASSDKKHNRKPRTQKMAT